MRVVVLLYSSPSATQGVELYHDEVVTPYIQSVGRKLKKRYDVLANSYVGGGNPDRPCYWNVAVALEPGFHWQLTLFELSWLQWCVRMTLVGGDQSTTYKAWLFEPYVSQPEHEPAACCPKCLSRDCDMHACGSVVEVVVIELKDSTDIFTHAMLEELPTSARRGHAVTS